MCSLAMARSAPCVVLIASNLQGPRLRLGIWPAGWTEPAAHYIHGLQTVLIVLAE